MQVGYRAARQCPECAAMLSELALGSAVVDRCPECGGLWIDWFDGEISSVASSARGLPNAPPPVREGTLGCPDCRATLVTARYPDERSGAEILRCGGCAGAFVPRRSLELVITLGPPEDAPPGVPPSRLALFWAELRRWLGGDD